MVKWNAHSRVLFIPVVVLVTIMRISSVYFKAFCPLTNKFNQNYRLTKNDWSTIMTGAPAEKGFFQHFPSSFQNSFKKRPGIEVSKRNFSFVRGWVKASTQACNPSRPMGLESDPYFLSPTTGCFRSCRCTRI